MADDKMSSEVEEKQVATEDATNTEKEAPVEEPTVPLHTVTKLRGRAQAAEVEAAELRGRLAGMQETQVKNAPAAMSPLDTEIARQRTEGIADEDMQISPAVIRADKLYEKQVANQETAQATAVTLANQQAVSLKASKIVHEDWQDVINAGEKLLSRGEHLDVTSAGTDFGEVAYAKCKAAIERNKPVKETPAAPEKKLSELEVKEKKEAEEKKAKEAPSQKDVLANATTDAARAFNL